MARIVPQSHPALHAAAEEVPHADITTPRIQKVIADMRTVLHNWKSEGSVGVAIAAPQIGVPLRIFLVEDMSDTDDAPRIPTLVAINPTLIKVSKKKMPLEEGCLSVPDHYGRVLRAERARIRAYDEHGREFEHGGNGLLAQIFQHEIDHLDGILFTERAETLWDKAALREMQQRAAHTE